MEGVRVQLGLLLRCGTRPTIVGIYVGLIAMCVSAFGVLNLIAPPLQPGPQASASSPAHHALRSGSVKSAR